MGLVTLAHDRNSGSNSAPGVKCSDVARKPSADFHRGASFLETCRQLHTGIIAHRNLPVPSADHSPEPTGQSGLQRALKDLSIEGGPPVIEEEILIEIDPAFPKQRDDEAILARFFGSCVLCIGVLTIVPAVYFWILTNAQEVVGDPRVIDSLSRWAYVLGFLGAMHVLYGLYVMQLVDYGALQMLSIFMLAVTCLYGFVAMSLWLDPGNGKVVRFLQLPEVLKSRAMIWCGIMFGISALGCYLFGRESMMWKRRQMARNSAERLVSSTGE